MEIKKLKLKRSFYKCPYCGKERLSICGESLNFYIREYFEYPVPYSKAALSSALKNLIKYKKIEGNIKDFLQDIDNNRAKYENESFFLMPTQPNKAERNWFLVDKYQHESIFQCYECKEIIPIEGWGIVEKEIGGYICPKCDVEVEDDENNYNMMKPHQILCPRCQSFIANEDLEILNEVPKEYYHELFDHIEYDSKNHQIIGQPYDCRGEALFELLSLGKKLGYEISIQGYSKHDKCCFSIHVKRQSNPNRSRPLQTALRHTSPY